MSHKLTGAQAGSRNIPFTKSPALGDAEGKFGRRRSGALQL